MTDTQLQKIKDIVEHEYASEETHADEIHGIDHIHRVYKKACKIAKQHEKSSKNSKKPVDYNLLEAVCYLHDITYLYHKPSIKVWFFESRYVKKLLDKLLKDVTLNKKDKKILYNAVINHPHSFPFRRLNHNGDMYTKILQDADTHDLLKTTRIRAIRKRFWLLLPIIAVGFFLLRKRVQWFLNLDHE